MKLWHNQKIITFSVNTTCPCKKENKDNFILLGIDTIKMWVNSIKQFHLPNLKLK